MKLHIIVPGKLREAACRSLVDEYTKRLKPMGAPLALHAVRNETARGGRSGEAALRKEADALIERVPAGHRIVALDERGKQPTSRELAKTLDRWRTTGSRGAAFLIGSADGLHPSVRERADLVLSLSRLTMPHELAIAVLAEQLYRAMTILAGHPYHRD